MEYFVLFTQLDLDLFPHVKYGTISARANDFFMQRALTTLALSPKPRKLVLQSSEGSDLLLVNAALLGLAVLADGVGVVVQRHLAPDASRLFLGESSQGTDFGRHHSPRQRVFAAKQCRFSLGLAQNGFEYSQQGLRQHVGQVMLSIDGNVVFQDVNRIL